MVAIRMKDLCDKLCLSKSIITKNSCLKTVRLASGGETDYTNSGMKKQDSRELSLFKKRMTPGCSSFAAAPLQTLLPKKLGPAIKAVGTSTNGSRRRTPVFREREKRKIY